MISAMASKTTWVAILSAALCAWVTGACATGAEGDDDDDGTGGGSSVPKSFLFRRAITIGETAPEGYSLSITIDHAQLVTDEKSAEDGADLRFFFGAGTEETEIDRVLDPASSWNSATTTVWFRTQVGVGPYYVYYGDSEAVGPPENGSLVFDFFDDFEDDIVDATWMVSEIGGATSGSVQEANGAIRLTGAAQDIGGTADNCVFLRRTMIGDFAVEAEIKDSGGSIGGPSKIGGLMVRETETAGSKNAMISIRNNPRARFTSWRTTDNGDTLDNEMPGAETFPQYVGMQRFGAIVSTLYSLDGAIWIQLGDQITLGTLAEAVQLGIPLANSSDGTGWVDTEWFRVRKLALPAPTVALGDEEEI